MRAFLLPPIYLLLTSSALAQSDSPNDWKINEEKSFIIFIARNLGLNVSGKVSGMQVTGDYNESNIMASSLVGSIDVTTISTGIDMRDNHLRSDDYFDVKKYPKITFRTKSITAESSILVATGDLTIKGVTKEEKIKFTVERKGTTRTFTGDITIQRKDYELGGNSTIVMADTIRVRVFVVFEQIMKG